jgi:S-formylglutathione hydrolase FrmB
MYKQVRCLVITPIDYTTKREQPYPVLYLLHGWSGHYTNFITDVPRITQLADSLQMMIVCPDGGYDSWYIDSPVDKKVRYDTHISQELVAYIDQHYHTRRDRAGRAISGISMGGHGAITLAAKHPNVYGAAGSICGGLDLRPFKINNWDLKGVLGHPLTHWKHWVAASAVCMVPRFVGADVRLFIDCGTEDFFIKVNRDMHQKLLDAKVPHHYNERRGAHDSDYWTPVVEEYVLLFDAFFKETSQK